MPTSSISRLRQLDIKGDGKPLYASVTSGIADLLLNDLDELDRPVLSFREYIQSVNPRYIFYPHCEVMIDKLQQVCDGEVTRLMIFMPPRAGKSETVSRLFPAYCVYRHPDKFFGLCSYGAELAHMLSRNARGYYMKGDGQLAHDAQAIKQWETPLGGGMWSAGVGGAITGKGFHFGSIDDPIKSGEDAQSEGLLDKHWDWYQSTFYTRQAPEGAAIIVTQTRWNMGDLSGRILEQEHKTDDPERWHIINFEAIKSERPSIFPATCTVVEDDRKPGEALNPERQPLEQLLKIKETMGSYWFSALYQQSPSAEEGNMWKREWFIPYDKLPTDESGKLAVYGRGFDWDTAYTSNEKNAANAYVESYRDAQGNVYIHDFNFRWCETPELVQWMIALGGPHYIEQKASGKSAKQFLDRAGIIGIEVDVPGGADKVSRTRTVLPIGEAKRIYVRRAILERLLDDDKQGILAFPNSKWKDVNDAVVQAITRHVGPTVTGITSNWDF